MIKVKRINPDDDVILEITAPPEVWRNIVCAISPASQASQDLAKFYDALHTEIYKLKR